MGILYSEEKEVLKKMINILRKRRLKKNKLLSDRMGEGKKKGVKRMKVKELKRIFKRLRKFVGIGIVGNEIINIEKKGMKDMGNMEENMVGEKCLKKKLKKRGKGG